MEEHARLAIACFVKGAAVESHLLDGLPGELAVLPRPELKGKGASKGGCSITKDALVEYAAGRELARTLCSSTFTGTEVTTMLKKREVVLLQADPTFKIDMCFLASLSSSTGVTMLGNTFEEILTKHTLSDLADAVPAFS
eukprot:5357344-Amphidinium_carterae.1